MVAAQPIAAERNGRLTIVMVEPDVMTRVAVAEYLRACGYMVIEVRSAAEALTVLESGRAVDVVFAEVDLPDAMNGFALAKHLRAQYPHLSIVLTSGAEGAAEKAGELCDDGPIAKPYRPEEVVRRIKLLRESKRTSKPG